MKKIFVGAMGSGTFAPFFTFLVENLVVWIRRNGA